LELTNHYFELPNQGLKFGGVFPLSTFLCEYMRE